MSLVLIHSANEVLLTPQNFIDVKNAIYRYWCCIYLIPDRNAVFHPEPYFGLALNPIWEHGSSARVWEVPSALHDIPPPFQSRGRGVHYLWMDGGVPPRFCKPIPPTYNVDLCRNRPYIMSKTKQNMRVKRLSRPYKETCYACLFCLVDCNFILIRSLIIIANNIFIHI